ncbi:hypothetical protein PpBr36_01640 [Pyricularia pennisetigena]|uniref:hypothetical protein n=1 Tax=Pyricularia pennisetigena TaxID=1578925 RepID=UPI0011525062|nr:hypothetical protein PpBr36_01640 [Pyricularia pennisetigena]TLS28047.1 hypothetical protein PpBr36_01640 [Pyricularia pennisetigena]
MLVHAGIKNKPLLAQKPHGLDKLLRQPRPGRLVLQQVLLDLCRTKVHGCPGDYSQTQRRILWAVALAVPRLAVSDASQPLDLHQREFPVPAFIVEPVRLEKDEALQVGGGAGRCAVLGQRVALAERVVRRVPLEGFELGIWVEVDVGIHGGKV